MLISWRVAQKFLQHSPLLFHCDGDIRIHDGTFPALLAGAEAQARKCGDWRLREFLNRLHWRASHPTLSACNRFAQKRVAQRDIKGEVCVIGRACVATFERLVEINAMTLRGELGRHLAGMAGVHAVIAS
jgi:hypothetical protein